MRRLLSPSSGCQMLGGATSDLGLGVIDVIEDEMAIAGIETDKHVFARIGSSHAVAMISSSDGELAVLAHMALPGEGG